MALFVVCRQRITAPEAGIFRQSERNIGYPCPFAKRMRELVHKEVGDGVRILDYTHDAGPEPETSQK